MRQLKEKVDQLSKHLASVPLKVDEILSKLPDTRPEGKLEDIKNLKSEYRAIEEKINKNSNILSSQVYLSG